MGTVRSVRRNPGPKPDWLRVERKGGEAYNAMKSLLRTAELNTICESGNCPNRGECFANRTATFMIMGHVCSRKCTFCNVLTGKADPLDGEEPRRVAETVRHLGLKFAVVTSVNRDEHPDGGSAQFAATIRWIRRLNPGCGVEVLTPDFLGNPLQLAKVLEARPDVFAHNLETVPRLDPEVRPQASQRRSLTVLQAARQWADAHGHRLRVKTGVMLGLGETFDEVVEVMRTAKAAGVDIFTIGQYLQPTEAHHPVERWVEPAEFEELARRGRDLGLRWVESGPLVRSSYHAREQAEEHDGAAPVAE
jgi:lipoic acid synthetase